MMLLSINSLHSLHKQDERNYHSFQFADETICNAQRDQELTEHKQYVLGLVIEVGWN